MDSSSNHNTLVNNTVNSNGKHGIEVDYSDFNDITGNNASLNSHTGIVLHWSDCNNIANNTVNSNKDTGIGLGTNDNHNNIINNTANNNQIGLYLSAGLIGNTVNYNTFCNNSVYDIQDFADSSNSGDENTCDLTSNWNDAGTTGCAYSCPAKPDLMITDIQCDEPEGRIGYRIKNVGGGVAPAGHETLLLVESQMRYEDEVDISLEPGDTYQGYFKIYRLAWSAEITICADHYDEVAEASEDNNCRGSECVVEEEEPPPTELLPDLIVDPYWRIRYYATTPEMLGFHYRIWNRGSARASATWTELYISGRMVAQQQVDPLDAGERRDERIEVLWDCTWCTEDRIEFRLDARNEVAEESELNNNHVETWTCSYGSRPGIDLAVEDIHFDSTDDKIKYTLSNRGAGDSLETESHLYIDGEEVQSRSITPLAGGHSREEYFNYEWRCTRNEDTIRVVVDSVTRVEEDCSGVEVWLGELDSRNNRAVVTWECELPDLIIEDISVDGDTVNYIITNQGNFTAGPTTTSLRFYEPSSEYGIWARGDLIDQCSDRVDELTPGESREESISAPCSCSPPLVHISVKADEDDSVIETYENNFLDFYWQCGVRGAVCDLSIERVWLEDRSRVCYEIMNLGSIASESTTTEIDLYSSCSFYRGHISHEEPELPAGQSRTVCLDISSSEPGRFDGTYCGCKRLEVDVETAPELFADPRNPHSNNILNAIFDNDNPCADGIQNHGEEGIDCGGPCPASCRDCFADAAFGRAEDAGYFRLDRVIVRNTARDALEEYANCLRDPACRATLRVTDPLMSFATVTADDLERSTDYIMEAVAYYVDRHTQYMFDDDDCDICDPGGGWALEPGGAINAEDMIWYSGERSGTISGDVHVDTCPNDYCGDCEDHAILREALMRSLGVSWRCAFCADHYNTYWGEGHTFNLVYYRNKWRIMDYGPLGSYFSEYWDLHNPNNVWNDRVGEYWCPDWRSDPACWYCCNHDPYSYTQNYNDGDACCLGSQDTYIKRCAP
jgi:parallel beta-helix repeat protein